MSLAKQVEKAGFNSPHENSIMGIALAEGDHEMVTTILDRAKVADDELRALERWVKRGFTEFGGE